ncbi:MAG: hypothetical protein NW200_12460 [Hyphomonadaceae bacterium]|nr:hypothetical protein [Hyphomonadaceae bacterium]
MDELISNEARTIARELKGLDNAAGWLLFMAGRGGRPEAPLALRANHALVVRFALVDYPAQAMKPRLTPLGEMVAAALPLTP